VWPLWGARGPPGPVDKRPSPCRLGLWRRASSFSAVEHRASPLTLTVVRSTAEESVLRWSQEGWRAFTHLTTRPCLLVSFSVVRWSQKFPQPCHQQSKGYLARNRVIAALADGVVVVQAEYRSGAISVAYHAAALGRHVGVVPGPWNDTRSAGCWRIYRECGAIVLTEPADISLVIPGVTHPTTI
jgi:hypothetical protein